MSIELITILLLATFIALLVTGLPLAWVMGATAVIFSLTLFGPNIMVMMVGRVYQMMLNYALVAVPLFIFMAAILQQSGVADQLFKAVYIWSGPFRGGLAIGTIISCTIMAAMVGIVGAEIVTFGMIALPGMLERKYDGKIALGSICAGGGMATLIPPSVVFIVYAMTAGASVGDLFIAGIIPGLLLGALFIGYIIIATWLKPEMAPAAPEEERNVPLKQKLALLKGLIMPGLLAAIVLGSIYAGVATPSEAAGIGCLGAIVTAAINRKLTFSGIKIALYDTVKISCMLAWLFFGAQTIIGIYTLAGGDQFVKNAVMALPFGKWGAIIGMQLILIFLGMFLDWIGIVLLTMPLFVPIILDLGFDNVWFGVVFCMNMHISYLSPPFGPSIFYLKSVVGDAIPVGQIYRANLPYLWLTFVALAFTVAFPGLSLWLPSMMLK
ncbi:MAG: TRAP transporter large permease subunit [Deltaproteobacteria bacterium]|uniref:TRAP transporter large permease subunit n=1 Tax=Candidatus Desulfacyla euxinica TaxID=2841693 RepID=A0A8J6T9P6_9DELT|nr:TRAP transporter large permease subunit [Candidatus Desulfacyla euxinica]